MDVALVGLVDERGWVLLQERDENAPTDPDRWSLVGRGIEPGETPADAARRELYEETRLVHEAMTPLGSTDLPCELHGQDRFFLFRGDTTATDGDVECHEGRQMLFVDPAVADTLDLTAATRQLLPLVTATFVVEQVDERDSGWEDDRPRFRMYLQDGGETSTKGSTETWDLTGVDVLQAIDRAQRRAGDAQTWAIALVRDDAQGRRGLVWLAGRDGNDRESGRGEAAAQQRMLARRRDPIRLPRSDRMPSADQERGRGFAAT